MISNHSYKNTFLFCKLIIVTVLLYSNTVYAGPFSPASGVIDPGQLTPAQQIEYGAPSCTPNDIDCYVAEKTTHVSTVQGTLLTTIVDGVKSVVDLTTAILDAVIPNNFSATVAAISPGDTVLSALQKLQGTNNNQDSLISTLTSLIAGKEDTLSTAPNAQYFLNGLKGWSLLDTQAVPENNNLYFTNARAIKSLLAGFVAGPSSSIVPTDSVLEAFGKTQAQIDTLNSTTYTNGLTNTGNNIQLGGILTNGETFIDGDGSESQLIAFGRNNTLKDFTINATTGNKDGTIAFNSDAQNYLATDALTLQETETGSFIKVMAKQKTGLFLGTQNIVHNTATEGQVLSLVNKTTGEVEFTTLPTAWTTFGNGGTTPTNNFIGTLDLNDLAFRTNNTEVMRIATSGNVGIGTDTPATRLHLKTTTAGPFGMRVESSDLSGNDIGYETASPSGQEMKIGHWSGAVQFYSMIRPMSFGTIASGQRVDLLSGGSTRMRVAGSGEIGINQNTPTQQLHVRGSTATLPGTSGTAKDASLRIESTTGNIAIDSGTTINVGWLQSRNKTNYGTQAPLLINPNGGNVGIYTGIATPGAYLTIGTTTTPSTNPSLRLQTVLGSCDHVPTGGTTELVTCSSDERLKSDIADSKPVLDDINNFAVRQYTFNASGVHYDYGVIAQEVLTHHPDMVHMRDDGYYGVEEISVWKLVKGMQELFTLADSFKRNLTRWFAETANGIDTFVTRTLKTDSVQAKNEICIGSTCLTEAQLQMLLQQYQTQQQTQPQPDNNGIVDVTGDRTQLGDQNSSVDTLPTEQPAEPATTE